MQLTSPVTLFATLQNLTKAKARWSVQTNAVHSWLCIKV